MNTSILVAAIGGNWVGLDVVSRSDGFADLWPNLLYSYAFEALLNRIPEDTGESGVDVASLLSRFPGAACEAYPAVGLGRMVRLETADAIGSALVAAEQGVHVALFRRGGRGQEKGGGMATASERRAYRE